ncbi:MAG: phosphatase PAP2 family protein [Candidatus Latescibacterota bacterium]
MTTSTSVNRMGVCALIGFFFLLGVARAENVDQQLYRTLHDSFRNPAMDALMGATTDLGGVKANLALCLVLSTYGQKYEKDTAKLTFTSLAATAGVASVLKGVVGRRRPEGRYDRGNSSFPSAHAAAAGATMTMLAHRYPRYQSAYYTLGAGIAFSRIYLGRHYPSDVLGGWAIGYLGSRCVLAWTEQILGIEWGFWRK